MNIVFMGTPDFAVGILQAIYEAGRHHIAAVVTQPDRPKGRKQTPVPCPVKVYATEHGIPVIQPEKIRAAGEADKLKALKADIFVVAAFGQILSKEILDIPKYGCINVHASLLPRYRGAAPIQRAIADGCEFSGVTIQQMNEGVDTGDIISSVKVGIAADETGGSLFDKLMNAGASLIVNTLTDIENGNISPTPQDESKASYAGMLKKEMGLLDFSDSAQAAERKIRAFTPWPGGYTYLDNRILKIKECCAVPQNGTPGTVIDVGVDSITIGFAEGALKVTRLQSEGKKEMSVHDYLLGNRIEAGTKLGINSGME